jgi:hypothetical protein
MPPITWIVSMLSSIPRFLYRYSTERFCIGPVFFCAGYSRWLSAVPIPTRSSQDLLPAGGESLLMTHPLDPDMGPVAPASPAAVGLSDACASPRLRTALLIALGERHDARHNR